MCFGQKADGHDATFQPYRKPQQKTSRKPVIPDATFHPYQTEQPKKSILGNKFTYQHPRRLLSFLFFS
jgi:hypothetical protein